MWNEKNEGLEKMTGGQKVVLVTEEGRETFYNKMYDIVERLEIKKKLRRVPRKVNDEKREWINLKNVKFCRDFQNNSCN